MQNNFKHTIEWISKQQLPKAHWGHSETKQQTHRKENLVSQIAH